jgi:hypothetical protein
VHLIVRRRGSVTMWLTTIVPQRWGDEDRAMRFSSRADARRAAIVLKLSGDWSIEPAGEPSALRQPMALTGKDGLP